jgi:hypothetical protein
MRVLGFVEENQDIISQHTQDEYAKLFKHPLSRSQLQALASLFWSILEDELKVGDLCVGAA